MERELNYFTKEDFQDSRKTYQSLALLFACLSFAFPGFLVVSLFFAGIATVSTFVANSTDLDEDVQGREVDYTVDDKNPHEKMEAMTDGQ